MVGKLLFGGKTVSVAPEGSTFAGFRMKQGSSKLFTTNPTGSIFGTGGRTTVAAGGAAGQTLFAAAVAAASSTSLSLGQPDVTVSAGVSAARVGQAWQLQEAERGDNSDDVFEPDEEEEKEEQQQPKATVRGRHASEVSEAGSEVSESGTKRQRIKRLARYRYQLVIV